MKMDTRMTTFRKGLVAGAAGFLLGTPIAFSAEPQSDVRSPQTLMHGILEREVGDVSTNIQPVAGDYRLAQSYPVQSNQAQPSGGMSFNSRYQSEVQRQLQRLYQEDGREMPSMAVPQYSPEVLQQGATPDGRSKRWSWLKPSTWGRRIQQTLQRPDPIAPAPDIADQPPEFNPGLPAQIPQQPPLQQPQQAQTQQAQPRRIVRPSVPDVPKVSPEVFGLDPESEPRRLPAVADEQPNPFAVEEPPIADAAPIGEKPPLLLIIPTDEDRESSQALAPPEEEPPLTADDIVVRPRLTRDELPSLEATLEVSESQSLQLELPEPAVAPELVIPAEPAAETVAAPFPLQLPIEDSAPRTGPYTGLSLDEDPFQAPEAFEPSRTPALPPLPFASDTVSIDADAPLQAPQPVEEQPILKPTTPSRSDVQGKMARIRERAGMTGFKGFCPVVLHDYRELVDAQPQFSAMYEGQQYSFSSQEALDAFMANPADYAPAGGGIDLVHYQRTGEQRTGSLDYALWYRGRLYLFESAENKAEFATAPRHHSFAD